MPLIEISELYKTYVMGENRVNALNGVSLSIDEHEFAAIVGPSGSGKSTLMNIIGCLDVATSGSYRFNGQEIGSFDDEMLSEVRNRTIGFVFQKFNLLSRMNAVENVELPLVFQGVPSRERRERAAAALESVGLKDRMKHTPKELSGGQQQRVAIARALITDPPLILADEPTGNLDSRMGNEVMSILEKLNDRGNTIVLITHDAGIAKKAKRTIRIMDGRIVPDEEAAAGEIYSGV